MKQCAYLVGNNTYPEAPLSNAVNDALDITIRLTNLGFACSSMTDATYKEMDVGLADFAKQLSSYDLGIFFFAGHGMQIDGVNYLGAVDTNFSSEIDAKHSSLSLNKVIDVMEKSGARTSIIILDACRSNPYERRWRQVGPMGLAPVYAPKGMLLGYATSPGQVARDGEGKNGAYTAALLTHIDQQDLSIESFFKRVRNTLSSSTNGQQISWEHTSLMGDYFFNRSRSDGTVTAYSESALADKSFHAQGPVGAIITALRSHNWYVQNPAVDSMTPAELDAAGKDELFVLGRNIYQAACGSAKVADTFVQSLTQKLASYSEFARFHLMNGILFEIYFDAQGRKRKKIKAEYLDKVYAFEGDPVFDASFKFIGTALMPYAAELFYFPGAQGDVCVDVVLRKDDKAIVVHKVCFEGQNVLYNDAGDGYYDPKSEFFGNTETRATFNLRLAASFAVPSFRLKASYSGVALEEDKFQAPHTPNLQRVQHK